MDRMVELDRIWGGLKGWFCSPVDWVRTFSRESYCIWVADDDLPPGETFAYPLLADLANKIKNGKAQTKAIDFVLAVRDQGQQLIRHLLVDFSQECYRFV